MISSLLLEQYPACLVLQTYMVCEMGGKRHTAAVLWVDASRIFSKQKSQPSLISTLFFLQSLR